MKFIPVIAAAILALSPLTVNAGGLAAAVTEPMMMDEAAPHGGSLNASILIPLLFIALVAVANGADGGDDSDQPAN